MPHLVVEVENVGAVPPLGEDDGVLLLPLQAATLGSLSGLRGDVVLRRQTNRKKITLGFLVAASRVPSPSSPLPLLSLSTAPLDRGAALRAQPLSSTSPDKVCRADPCLRRRLTALRMERSRLWPAPQISR